jgi:hypothetical protein
MQVGDLVRCVWQPRVSKHVKGKGCIAMKHTIKGELGIITELRNDKACFVTFPQFGYTHPLANSTLEVINESH